MLDVLTNDDLQNFPPDWGAFPAGGAKCQLFRRGILLGSVRNKHKENHKRTVQMCSVRMQLTCNSTEKQYPYLFMEITLLFADTAERGKRHDLTILCHLGGLNSIMILRLELTFWLIRVRKWSIQKE